MILRKIIFLSFCLLPIFASSQMNDTMKNPLLEKLNTPFGSIPFDKIKPEHYKPAFDYAFAHGRDEIDAITKCTEDPNFKNTVEAIEQSFESLNVVVNVFFNLLNAETNDSLQLLAEELAPAVTGFINDLFQNEDLFRRVDYVYKNDRNNSLTAEQQTLLDKTYKKFIRNGVNLDPQQKEEFKKITRELSELSVKFGKNVLAETNAYTLHITDTSKLAGLPEGFLQQAREEAESKNLEGWVFTMQYPVFSSFMKYTNDSELRKEFLMTYSMRGLHDNEYNNCEIIKRISELRLKMANLLGYKTYAEYILTERMAENPEKVNDFLNKLLDASMPYARKDLAELQEFALQNHDTTDIMPWDVAYYAEKLKMRKYTIDDEATRPYFPLERIQNSVFDLATKLYGLTFRKNAEISVYHPDVTVFEVYDKDGTFLSLLYLDYFPREGKRQGAWMTSFKEQFIINGINVRPHVSLVFNFNKPTREKPSLLSLTEVRTILHEFGHALHTMLSQVTYQSLSGTSVYRDFVELPSQIMENWADEKVWLDMVGSHYQTGEKIPAEMLENLFNSRNFNSGSSFVRQVSLGMLDLAWNNLSQPMTGDVIEYEKKIMEPTRLLPYLEGTAISATFNHIFEGGYAAGYYGYKWAEVLDADAFSLFRQNGIFDQATAQSFRDNILSKGGTEHPMKLYLRFRGQQPSIEPLLERSGLLIQ